MEKILCILLMCLQYFHRSSGMGCASNAWECRNGHCIDEEYLCNGHNDCGDDSDEANCVRLIAGDDEHSGRVEINLRNEWGTICDHQFDNYDATVVCRMMGYGGTAEYLDGSKNPGFGQIWLDEVICDGSENSVLECSHSGLGVHNCTHSQDVSISCMNHIEDIRLLNGSTDYSGRVEIKINGTWGTICDDQFDDLGATVLCNMLGYTQKAHFMEGVEIPGEGSIWLDDVQCTGNESSILDCSHSGLGRQNCLHDEDVAIRCMYNVDEVQLVDGPNWYTGRVEVKLKGVWGTLCDDGMNDNSATVLCRMMGYSHSGRFLQGIQRPGTGTIWLDNLWCRGNEYSILDCEHSGLGQHNCFHIEDAVISCMNNIEDIRLEDGTASYNGRVEIKINGTWGTICHDSFDDADATVLCRMLGYSENARHMPGLVNPGSGVIWLNHVRCTGAESSIEACSHYGLGQHNCTHHQDVSVSCMGNVEDIRLHDGPNRYSGRVEIKINGTWGSICDDNFGNAEATVLCRMLGFNDVAHFMTGKYIGISGAIWLDEVNCTGSEASILDCFHSGLGNHDCQHIEDVALRCKYNVEDIRLRNNREKHSGRVEIKVNGIWGTICDDFFDDTAADVICNMLGYKNNSHFMRGVSNPGSGRIWLDDIRCIGRETSIMDCEHNSLGRNNCHHLEDVSVRCQDHIEGVRLADGPQINIGRVEVQVRGQWGTICDDRFDVKSATVLCRMMGYNGTALFLELSRFPGTGPIWLDGVVCTGRELTILDCQHNGLATHNCKHGEDATIMCN